MNIGELKHRVTIEQCVSASDGQGGYTSTWTTLGSVWASVAAGSAMERFYRGEQQHTQVMTFTVRQKQAFTMPQTTASEKLRLQHRGVYFAINTIKQNKYELDFFDIECTQYGAVTQ